MPDEEAPAEAFPAQIRPSPVEGPQRRILDQVPQAVPKAPPNIGGGIWLAQGPGPGVNGQVEGITPGPGEVVGAIHTVAAHPTDPDILYAGGANGGIWKTTNATATSPFWTPLTDFETSLSIGALEFDSTDLTHMTLVAGIGRYSAFALRGGVRSGLLRTTDGGGTWTPIDGTGAIAGSNISGVAPRGSTIVATANVADLVGGFLLCSDIGIFRSTDTGTTFPQVTYPSGPAGFAFDLASDPASPTTLYSGLTFVSTCSPPLTNGIYKSTNTGATWTKVSSAAMDALIVDGTTNNIEIAADGSDVFVNILKSGRSVGIFYSVNGGASWTAMDLPRTPEGGPVPIAPPDVLWPGTPIIIDHSPTGFLHGLSTGAEVEVVGVTSTTGANGVWTITALSSTVFALNNSSDSTAWVPAGPSETWTKVAGLNPRVKAGSQGSIHASIRTDPTTPTTVYLGGDRQDSPFPNYIGAMDFSGRLFRGDATIAATGAIPSPQWEHLTHSNSVALIPGGGTAGVSAPHADSREIVFDANGELIEVDDAGIYRRTSPANNTGDWFSINGNIEVTEQHDVAYDAVSDIIISGNQDTGTTQQKTPHDLVWDSIHTADGGDVQVDDTSTVGKSLRYSSFQYLSGFRRREYDSSNALLSEVFPTLTVTAPDDPLFTQFTTPVELNARDQTRLVIVGCNSVYESLDKGDSLTQVPGLSDPDCSPAIFASGQNAVAYGGMSGMVDNKDVLYVGSLSSVYKRTTAGGSLSVLGAYPGTATVQDIVLDPTEWKTAFVADVTKVYYTTDQGSSWTDITGNLTDSSLQAAAYIPGSPDRLVVGGRDGVFALNLPPSGPPFVWGELGTGLPNAPVWDLEYDSADSVLVAGTLGRGAWTLQENGSCGHPDEVVLRNLQVSSTRTDTACKKIFVGPNARSASPANWTIVAGAQITLEDGVTLGGDVTLEINAALLP